MLGGRFNTARAGPKVSPLLSKHKAALPGAQRGREGRGQNKQTAFSIRQHLQLTLAEQLQITPKEARGGYPARADSSGGHHGVLGVNGAAGSQCLTFSGEN